MAERRERSPEPGTRLTVSAVNRGRGMGGELIFCAAPAPGGVMREQGARDLERKAVTRGSEPDPSQKQRHGTSMWGNDMDALKPRYTERGAARTTFDRMSRMRDYPAWYLCQNHSKMLKNVPESQKMVRTPHQI